RRPHRPPRRSHASSPAILSAARRPPRAARERRKSLRQRFFPSRRRKTAANTSHAVAHFLPSGRAMRPTARLLQRVSIAAFCTAFVLGPLRATLPAGVDVDPLAPGNAGKRLFEKETFGGNGRTCRTCHSRETGTVSPDDAQQRFVLNPDDALFRGDGSDDGAGNGVTRMLLDATIL